MQLRDEQTPDHVGRNKKSILSRPNSLQKGGLYTKCHGKAPSKERCPQASPEPSACKAKHTPTLSSATGPLAVTRDTALPLSHHQTSLSPSMKMKT